MLFRYGKFTVDNLIHLVLDSPHDLQPTLWYICEFNSWRNSENWPITRLKSSSPSSSYSSQERDAATAKKDLSRLQEEKHQQLVQREKDLAQREKDFEQKEKNLEKKEKNLAQKENLLQQNLLRAELREREALEFEQEAKIKLDELDEKEQELEAEKLALEKNKIKNKYEGRFSSIPTHHNAENADDDENHTTNENNNQWLLRFSNLQHRLEIAYREIENLRRPVSSAAATKTTTTTNTATTAAANNNNNNNDNDNNNNDNNNNNNNDTDEDNDDNDNENSSSTITSLQHELKLTKENAEKHKEENILLRKTMNQSKNLAFSEQNVSSERNLSSLRRRCIRDNLVDNLVDVDDDEEASSVGNRWAPLNFRVERMRGRGEEGMGSATTTGRREGEEEEGVGMIEMQKEFRFLGRLR